MRFNPNQLRAPQGTPDGGQWVDAYHVTSPANVAGIRALGIRPGTRGLSTYVSTSKEVAHGYGEAVIHVRVPKKDFSSFRWSGAGDLVYTRDAGVPSKWVHGVTTYPLGVPRTRDFGPQQRRL